MTIRPELSIVIPHYETPELTLACLESLLRWPPRMPYEILLMDNGSHEDFENDVEKRFPGVRFIRNTVNKGFANACNLGISNAPGSYIALLNSDTCLNENVFDPLVACLQADPKIGAVGPRHVDGDGRFQLSCGKFPTLLSELLRKILHYRLSIHDHKIRDYLDNRHSEIREVDWVSGSCVVFRRASLAGAGLLDERFFMYFEDIDLCRRLQLAGWRIHFYPHVSLVHYGGRSAAKNLMRVYVEYRRSQLYFARKYYGSPGMVTIRFLLTMKYGLHALRVLPFFVFRRLRGLSVTESYTLLLLSKKVFLLTFDKVPTEPRVPPLSSGVRLPNAAREVLCSD